MREIKLRELHIENFKGLRLFDISFDDSLTRIAGANGTGKTTLFDAYLWLLTGSDSAESAAFRVQPIDTDARTIDHLTTSVSATFCIDGITHEFTRLYKQKWSRPRGTDKDVMTGNTSEYLIDNVPMTLTEYNSKVASLLCKSEDFKLLSSVKAFARLDTKTKRSKLMQMAGQLPEPMNSADFPRLYQYWEKVKSVDAIKKTVQSEIAKLNDEKKRIPVMLNENERDMPEGYDFDAIRADITTKKNEIAKIDVILRKKASGKSGAYEEAKRLASELRQIESDLIDIETSLGKERERNVAALQSQKSTLALKVAQFKSERSIAENTIASLNGQADNLSARLADLRKQWTDKNEETFSDTIESVCPTCKRPFSGHEMAEMRQALISAFNSGKSGMLKAIANNGDVAASQLKGLRAQISARESEIEEYASCIAKLETEWKELDVKIASVPTLEQAIAAHREHATLMAKKDELARKIGNATSAEDTSDDEYEARERTLNLEIERLIGDLALEGNIAKVKNRRKELEAKDAELSAKIAELDGVLFEIQRYQKEKIALVENTVSSKFRRVRWKMYESNLTNDGEKEICECLVDGVPVSTNVNTAGVVNAGIDIINAMSEWLGVSVPLWIDGKESVTELLSTQAQLITLSVVENSALKVV